MRRLVVAEGLEDVIGVDSAGTSAEHLGEAPDRRAQVEATNRGIDICNLRARRVTAADWDDFDLLLVADGPVERSLRRQAPRGADLAKVRSITDFASGAHFGEVPDPYYGGADGFRDVYDLLEDACAGILDHARREIELLDR